MTPVQRSLFFSAVERYASMLLFMGATAALARLLSPAEFGTFAVAGAIASVITATFQEFGGATYLIQRHDLSVKSLRSAFTLTCAISAGLCAGLCLLANPLARFFGQPDLALALNVTALNFLVTPFSGTAAALFRRELDFRTLAYSNLASGAVGNLVAIMLALYGSSFMAPIWGGLAGNATLAALLVARRPEMRSLRPCFADCRDVVGFGAYSSGVSVINVLYNLAPQLLLARLLDFTTVGLYSRAVSITQVFDKLVTQVLNPVVMPAFVTHRSAGADLKRIYLESVQALAVVQWPALLFVALMARPIILIWLGPNWLDIVPLVRLLCVGNMALFAACLSYPALVATGGVRDSLVASLISVPLSILVILGATFFGVEAVAASSLVTLPFQAAVSFRFVNRRLGIRSGELARAVAKSFGVTALTAAGLGVCILVAEASNLGAFLTLVCAGAAAFMCWLAGLAATSHPLLSHLRSSASALAARAPGLSPKRSPT